MPADKRLLGLLLLPLLAHGALLCVGAPRRAAGTCRRARSCLASSIEHAAAAEQLLSAQANVLEQLRCELQLAEIDSERFELPGSASAVVSSFEAPSRDVVSCSATQLSSAIFASSTLTVWNGPAIDVPHLFVRCGVAQEAIELELDFRPRLHAAYEACDPDGSAPPPSTRAEFQQAALRDSYDAAYFTPEARAWAAAVGSEAGACGCASAFADTRIEGRRQFGENSGAICGPLLVSVRLPMSAAGVAVAVSASAAATERWLGWMRAPVKASWMQNRMIYDRDCQVRQLLYAAALKSFEQSFGAAGAALAAAEAGRLDMMGHNMMQEQKGFGSDADEGRD